MLRRSPKLLLPALLALLAALALGACGGDDASSQNVNTLLEETFSGNKDIKSGTLDLEVGLDTQGQGQQGPVSLALKGPFVSGGEGKLPQFKMAAKVTGAGQNLEAGATSTGDKGFVDFQGQPYVLSDQVFAEFKKGFEQAQAQQGQQKDQSLASLGIDPRKWLTNAKNEGESKVGDEDTVKITGGVDVGKLLEDVNNALGRAAQLGGGQGGQIPERLTDAQKRDVQEAVKNVAVEIHTGKDDKILRRMVIAMDLTAPQNQQGVQNAKVKLDLSLTDLNEDQKIEAPANAKPFDELAQQLGGLGLGGLGGGQSDGADPNAGGGGAGGASDEALEKYSSCIREAGEDVDKAQKCAELLSSP